MTTQPTFTGIHKTRKSAAAHLEQRGWVRGPDSYGDWTFRREGVSYRNIIVAKQNGTWRIEAYPFAPRGAQ